MCYLGQAADISGSFVSGSNADVAGVKEKQQPDANPAVPLRRGVSLAPAAKELIAARQVECKQEDVEAEIAGELGVIVEGVSSAVSCGGTVSVKSGPKITIKATGTEITVRAPSKDDVETAVKNSQPVLTVRGGQTHYYAARGQRENEAVKQQVWLALVFCDLPPPPRGLDWHGDTSLALLGSAS